MRLSFVECMRGAVRGADGMESPISFEVHAAGEGGGRFALTGIVRAPPWIDEAPVQGTLTIAALLRSIAYELHFTAADGAALLLKGAKSPTPVAPLESMTSMPVELLDGSGAPVAQGTMRFDLADLLPFAASWLPIGRRAQRSLDARRRLLVRRALDQD